MSKGDAAFRRRFRYEAESDDAPSAVTFLFPAPLIHDWTSVPASAEMPRLHSALLW